jgi:hypothetical protein
MVERSKRLKCDICGRVSDWIIVLDNEDPIAQEDLKEWRFYDLGNSWRGDYKPKDYCSKECVIKDIEKQYEKTN